MNNEETNNHVQKQKNALEKSKANLKRCKFNPNEEVAEDKIYFTIDGEIIGTEGNLVVFNGLPKAGKSTYISAAIASSILKAPVFGMQFHVSEDKYKIVCFDTEQSKYSMKKQVCRIYKFAKVNKLKNVEFFRVKEFEAQEIIEMIDAYLADTPEVAICIIDGLVDMLDNFNDEGQSKKVIKHLKRWGSMYGCLFVGVLHVGKKDGFSLGHLGSATDRYCQSALEVVKEKDRSIVLRDKITRESGGITAKAIMYSRETDNFYQMDKVEDITPDKGKKIK